MVLQEAAPKKKGRKEIKLTELDEPTKQLFTKEGGSDEKEWQAWLDKGACEVVSFEESQRILRERPDQVIPTRWVRTNKSEGKPDEEFFAKSRLVVQGFKDRSLGSFRRDAPTASALAESICLTLVCSLSVRDGLQGHQERLFLRKGFRQRTLSTTTTGRTERCTTRPAAESQEGHLWVFRSSKTFLASVEGAPRERRMERVQIGASTFLLPSERCLERHFVHSRGRHSSWC